MHGVYAYIFNHLLRSQVKRSSVKRFLSKLAQNGWDNDTMLLSTSEKIRYVRVGKA